MENKKPRALFILTPGFPENEADSTCIPPRQVFVKSLKEAAPDLTIIVLTLQYPFFSGRYEWHGIKIMAFGAKHSHKLWRCLTMVRVWLTLTKLAKDYRLMGLLSFWFGKCAFIGNAFAKRYRLKHFCWILGQDAKAGNKFFNRIRPESSCLIALSDFIAREFNKNYGVLPQHIIPAGIDISLFGKTGGKRDIDILGAGSLIPLKQYQVFLEVVQLLRTFFPDIKAVLCGDGPEMPRLLGMVAALKLEAAVTLTGSLPHAEVLALMQRSKILLHPSNYEGFGSVCLEALYAGAHVVSFVKPMDAPITNWHIAADEHHMINLLKDILYNPAIAYQPVLPYTIQAVAGSVLKLFDYNDEAIC